MAAPTWEHPATRVRQHTARVRYRRRVAESEELMTPVQPAQLSRRMIIGLGLAAPTLAVPWLAGCSSDDPAAGNPVRAAETPAAPTSSPAATSTPSPSPTAAASSPPPAAAAPEQALAASRGSDPWRTTPSAALQGPPCAADLLAQCSFGTCPRNRQPASDPSPCQARRAITERLARTLGAPRDCRRWPLPPGSATDHGVGGPAVGLACDRRRRLRCGA